MESASLVRICRDAEVDVEDDGLSKRALVAAWLAAFVFAWGELPASLLLVPPGVATLPITIFGLLHYGVDDRIAGIALVLFGMTGLFVGLSGWLLHKIARPD